MVCQVLSLKNKYRLKWTYYQCRVSNDFQVLSLLFLIWLNISPSRSKLDCIKSIQSRRVGRYQIRTLFQFRRKPGFWVGHKKQHFLKPGLTFGGKNLFGTENKWLFVKKKITMYFFSNVTNTIKKLPFNWKTEKSRCFGPKMFPKLEPKSKIEIEKWLHFWIYRKNEKLRKWIKTFFFRARINFFEIRGREIFLARPGPDRLLPYLLLFPPWGKLIARLSPENCSCIFTITASQVWLKRDRLVRPMATQMEDNGEKRRRGTFSQRTFLGSYLALA